MRVKKVPQSYGSEGLSFFGKISRPPVLYSGHKESGLIRISLSIGLGGPGWARGLYMDRKKRVGVKEKDRKSVV